MNEAAGCWELTGVNGRLSWLERVKVGAWGGDRRIVTELNQAHKVELRACVSIKQ